MTKVKKIFFLLVISIFSLVLFACKKVDLTKIKTVIGDTKLLVENITTTEKSKDEISVFDLNRYAKKQDVDALKKILEDAEKEIKTKISHQRADELLKTITDAKRKFIADKVFFGQKASDYENTKDGVKKLLKDIADYISKLTVLNNASEATPGALYILKKDVEDFKEELKNEVENKLDTTPINFQELIEKGQELLSDFKKKFKTGEVISDIELVYDEFKGDVEKLLNGGAGEKLDFKGAAIEYYTHNVVEDDPFNPGYKSDAVNVEEYKNFLTDIQTKYNFKIDFKTPSDYFKFPQEIANDLLSSSGNKGNAKIIRVSRKAELLDHIKLGNFSPIDSILNKIGDKYLINNWQRERGKIFGKTFGIQRFEGVTYPDMLVFNTEILKNAGVDKMPDELWDSKKWNLDSFKEMLQKIKDHNQNNNIIPFGLTPTFFGTQTVLANGESLIDLSKSKISEQLLIDQSAVTNILATYHELHSSKLLQYKVDEQKANKDFDEDKLVGVNHMRDAFNDGTLGFTMVQNWSMPFEKLSEYGIVPFPQTDEQDNSKYISPIEAGDLLSVTRGEYHQETALILLLINDFVKKQYEKYYTKKAQDFSITGSLSEEKVLNDLLIEIWIDNKISFSSNPAIKEEQKERARKICAFMHGYKTTKNYETSKVIASELEQVGATTLYSLALQLAYKNNDSSFAQKIKDAKNLIETEYTIILNQTRRFIIK